MNIKKGSHMKHSSSLKVRREEAMNEKKVSKKNKRKHKQKKEHQGGDISDDTCLEDAAANLLLLSELGETKYLRRVLRRTSVDVNTKDILLQTGLHKAAAQGHEDIIKLLLRYNADPVSRDMEGNTPAHIAAFSMQMASFTTLMLADNAPDMETPNERGITIRAAMQRMVQIRSGTPAGLAQEDSHSEDEWAERLRMNEDFDRDDMDHFSGFADLEQRYERGGDEWSANSGCNEDDYARKIWEEMNRRKHAKQGPSAATADTWAKADELSSHAKRVREAAEQAKERSRKILEEEEAKDRAWRQAVAQGDLGVRRATYEAKWHAFSVGTTRIQAQDVPWLLDDGKADVKTFILYGTQNQKEERQRLKLELMRWHPDKFQGRFAHRLDSAQKEEILNRVKHISQLLNGLLRA